MTPSVAFGNGVLGMSHMPFDDLGVVCFLGGLLLPGRDERTGKEGVEGVDE